MSDQPWGTPPSTVQLYATRVAFRSPEWKVHRGIGPAKNAVTLHSGSAWSGRVELWKLKPEGWVRMDTRTLEEWQRAC